MKITCDIIRDLLPSYIDQVCSEDSRNLVDEHLRDCENCRTQLEFLEEPVTYSEISHSEEEKVKAPFQKIKKKNRLRIFLAIFLTGAFFVSACMTVQNVRVLHDFFFPMESVMINSESEENTWKQITFVDGETLNFDSVFYNEELTNDSNSDGSVRLRILDKQGNTVIGETEIASGTSLDLKQLKKYTDYIVEVKTSLGRYFLNFY